MQQQQQQSDYVADVLSPQLARKMAPRKAMMPTPASEAQFDMEDGPAEFATRRRLGGGGARPRRQNRDTLFRWNALPNEYIVPIGDEGAQPVKGGSVSKLLSRGVLRFPSSVQRIEFRTDNISNENQGILVEGWACWRVLDPKLAVEKLDFSDVSDPMAKTCQILAIQCAGIMKGLISIKTVADLLKRREDLIDQLRDKLGPTEQRWGISFDEIGISEVQVLSQDVFENLQRPFRNDAREVAATSDLETEERIARKQADQRERVAEIESGNRRKLSELNAKAETEVQDVELKEERKRIMAEKEVKDLRLEEESRIKTLQAKLAQDQAIEREKAGRAAELVALEAEQERALRELQAQERRKVEELRLGAERERATAEAEQQIQASRLETERTRRAAEQELARLTAELETERREAQAAARRFEAELEAELQRLKAEVEREAHERRLALSEREREIRGRYSDAEIRMKIAESLPEIAGNVQVGDVRWYGGGGDGGSPLGIVGRAVDEVLEVAAAHGLDVSRLGGGSDGGEDLPS